MRTPTRAAAKPSAECPSSRNSVALLHRGAASLRHRRIHQGPHRRPHWMQGSRLVLWVSSESVLGLRSESLRWVRSESGFGRSEFCQFAGSGWGSGRAPRFPLLKRSDAAPVRNNAKVDCMAHLQCCFIVRGSMAALAWMKECPFHCRDARSTRDIGRRIGKNGSDRKESGRSHRRQPSVLSIERQRSKCQCADCAAALQALPVSYMIRSERSRRRWFAIG